MGGGWRHANPVAPPPHVESSRSSLALAALAALVVVGVISTRAYHDACTVDGMMNITMTEFDAWARQTSRFPKGDKGDAGPAGAKGDKGDKGDKGPAGDKGDKGDTDFGGIVPTRTHQAPNLAWLCPLCTCSPGKLCDAIHARATKVIVNFRAACTLCPADSETAESILESTEADVFFLDVAYPFRSVDTCGAAGGPPLHTCVLCDNVTGVEPNCGIDNLGKMRDLRVTAERDVDCRSGRQAQCACVHAEELTPVSWAECAVIVQRNIDSVARKGVRAFVAYEDENAYNKLKEMYARAGLVRYHGYVQQGPAGYFASNDAREVGMRLELDGDIHTFPRDLAGLRRACSSYDDESCRPARLLLRELPAAFAALGDTSVAAAIAKFYATDKDAAGHATIKAVCRARGAGTTCGGLSPLHAKTSREFAMLVPFAPITSDGTWLQPVVLFSV